jgi:DNA polymerase III gamma/tau subunit
LTGALLDGDARAGLRFADEVVAAGADEREALGELLAVLRAVLLVRVDGPETDLLGSLVAQRTQLQLLASRADVDRLDAMIQAVLRGRAALRHSDDRSLLLELTLIRVAQAGQLPALAELAARVAAGAGSAPPGAAAATAAPPAPAAPRVVASGALPAAARAAQATPPAPRGDELRARVLERAKQDLPTAVSTLELCRLDGPDAQGVVRITLASDKKLHRDRLGSPGVQDELQKLVSAAAGRIVRLQIDIGGGADAAATAPPARAPRAQPGPAARNVIERFDGRLVDSEES